MKYYIDPFGCVKNQVDAENMMAHLENTGCLCVNEAEDADTIIVNSCGFIESAKQESIDAVLNWKKLFPQKKVILAGCLAIRYEDELKESLPEIDIVNELNELTRIKKLNTGERPLLSLPGSAYVKISDGCNNNCSYCAIPLIRGTLKSRSIPDIVKECKMLLNRGIKEINIVGQDIASFGYDKVAITNGQKHCSLLPDLLSAISKIKQPEHFWVRLLYIHPDHFPLEILDIMEKDQRFLPYFDIPFQHASEKILKAMNRKGCAKQYLELIKKIRQKLPLAVIRSTFLLGFPGETEEDFSCLLDFQKNAKIDWLGCFAYSREDGTPAYSIKEQVSKKIALERKNIIEKNQIPITEKAIDKLIKKFKGQDRVVLIEEEIKGDDNSDSIFLGRLYCHAPEIDGAAVIINTNNNLKPKPGEFALCKIALRRGFDIEVKI